MSAAILTPTKEMPHDEWLQWRRKGIGGSDVAAIVGASKWKSPMEVYLDKIGELPPKEDNRKMEAGRRLEPLIADWFEEEVGLRVMRRNAIFQHKKYPFMLANIDRWIVGENAGLEIKNTSEYMRSEWENEQIPIEYKFQANHYMAVMNAERWFVAVLIGGWDFQWRVIERDDELIEALITVEINFWNNHVIPRVPPPVTAQDTGLIDTMYPESEPETSIDLGEEHYQLIQRVRETKIALDQAKNDFEDARNKMKMIMGNHEMAWFQGEPVFSWKTNKRGVRTFKILGGDI